MKKDPYFSKLYRQSLYRKHSNYEKADRHIQEINTKFDKISVDTALSKKLKDKIKKMSDTIIKNFLSEELIKEIQEDGHLSKIYRKLDLK